MTLLDKLCQTRIDPIVLECPKSETMFMGFYSVWIDIPEDVGGGSDRWYSKWSPAVRGDARMSGHAGPVTWQLGPPPT